MVSEGKIQNRTKKNNAPVGPAKKKNKKRCKEYERTPIGWHPGRGAWRIQTRGAGEWPTKGRNFGPPHPLSKAIRSLAANKSGQFDCLWEWNAECVSPERPCRLPTLGVANFPWFGQIRWEHHHSLRPTSQKGAATAREWDAIIDLDYWVVIVSVTKKKIGTLLLAKRTVPNYFRNDVVKLHEPWGSSGFQNARIDSVWQCRNHCGSQRMFWVEIGISRGLHIGFSSHVSCWSEGLFRLGIGGCSRTCIGYMHPQ